MQEVYSDIGNNNLEAIENAPNFTEWMYAQVKPYLQGTILEVGSGTGTYSQKVINDFPTNPIILSEIDPDYLLKLAKNFTDTKHLVKKINLEEHTDLLDVQFDSAFALNVFEHIEHDDIAFKNIYNHLNHNGVFVILVPAHQWLYNRIDSAIGHFRRYSKKELVAKATAAGFSVKHVYYFNFFSMFGWYLNGKILKKQTIDTGLLKTFNTLVPFFRFFEEKILQKSIGISLIAILEKK